MQIHDSIKSLTDVVDLEAVCVYGGVPKDTQRKALKKASIVIATPGRLKDLIEEGSADITSVDFLILDEADRMLERVSKRISKLLFSLQDPNHPSAKLSCSLLPGHPKFVSLLLLI